MAAEDKGFFGFECGAAEADLLLLCDEETKSFCFDDGDFVETSDDRIPLTNGEEGGGRSDSEPLIPLPFLSEDCVSWMLERERQHLPRGDYLSRLRSGELDLSLRREALDWMFKVIFFFFFGIILDR